MPSWLSMSLLRYRGKFVALGKIFPPPTPVLNLFNLTFLLQASHLYLCVINRAVMLTAHC